MASLTSPVSAQMFAIFAIFARLCRKSHLQDWNLCNLCLPLGFLGLMGSDLLFSSKEVDIEGDREGNRREDNKSLIEINVKVYNLK